MRKGPFCGHEGKTHEDNSKRHKYEYMCGCTHMHRSFTQRKTHDRRSKFCVSLEFLNLYFKSKQVVCFNILNCFAVLLQQVASIVML